MKTRVHVMIQVNIEAVMTQSQVTLITHDPRLAHARPGGLSLPPSARTDGWTAEEHAHMLPRATWICNHCISSHCKEQTDALYLNVRGAGLWAAPRGPSSAVQNALSPVGVAPTSRAATRPEQELNADSLMYNPEGAGGGGGPGLAPALWDSQSGMRSVCPARARRRRNRRSQRELVGRTERSWRKVMTYDSVIQIQIHTHTHTHTHTYTHTHTHTPQLPNTANVCVVTFSNACYRTENKLYGQMEAWGSAPG